MVVLSVSLGLSCGKSSRKVWKWDEGLGTQIGAQRVH